MKAMVTSEKVFAVSFPSHKEVAIIFGNILFNRFSDFCLSLFRSLCFPVALSANTEIKRIALLESGIMNGAKAKTKTKAKTALACSVSRI